MMLVSFLQRLGFRSEAPPPTSAEPVPVARSQRRAGAATAHNSGGQVGEPIAGINLGLPARSAGISAPGKSPRSTPSVPRFAPSGKERRPVVKASAKKTTTTAPSVKTKAPERAAAAAGKATAAKTGAKSPVKTPSKPAAAAQPGAKAKTPAAKPAAPAAKPPVKPLAKAVSKPVAPAKAAGAPKPIAKSPTKVAAKTSPKTLARSVPQTASQPVIKTAPQADAKAPAPSKPAAAAAPKAAKQTNPVAVASASKPATSVSKSAQAKAQAAVEPTPRPLGKRAAKKVMMEQMTQAEVVPTHAPNAAKATFSTVNERVVMTPPVPSAIRKDPLRANNWKTLAADKLTDEDVLAMPDDEYMSEFQLGYFRRKLIQLRDDMLANAGETTEHLREDTVVVPDPADRATIEEEHALELRTRDRERKLLKKIEQAIGRIDSGEYGYCDETGEAIGVGRLMARPTASLSLEAQQRRELKQKMFGD